MRKYIFTTLILVLGVFVFPSISFGAVPQDQEDFSGTSKYFSSSEWWAQEFGDGYTGTVKGITIKLDAANSVGGFQWYFCSKSPGSVYYPENYGDSLFYDGSCGENDSGIALNSGVQDYEIVFDNPVTLSADNHYVLSIDYGTGGGLAVLGAQTDQGYDLFGYSNGSNNFTEDTTVKDIYFILDTGAPSVSLSYPSDSVVLDSEFSHWRVTVDGGDSGFNGNILIQWTNTVDNLTRQDVLFDVSAPALSSSVFWIPHTSGTMYDKGTITATPSLDFDFVGDSIDFTVTDPFVLDTGSSSSTDRFIFPETFTTSTDSSASIFFKDCSEFDGPFFSSSTINGFVCGIEKAGLGLLKILLVPPDAFNDFLSLSFGNLQDVFPFNLFFELRDAMVDGVEVAETSSTSIADFNIGNSDYGTTTITVTYLSSTTLSDIDPNLKVAWFNFVLAFVTFFVIMIFIKST